MSKCELECLAHLPSQALLLCLQQLLTSMQEEQELEDAQLAAQSLPSSPPVSTELWRKEDLDAFVDVLHSI